VDITFNACVFLVAQTDDHNVTTISDNGAQMHVIYRQSESEYIILGHPVCSLFCSRYEKRFQHKPACSSGMLLTIEHKTVTLKYTFEFLELCRYVYIIASKKTIKLFSSQYFPCISLNIHHIENIQSCRSKINPYCVRHIYSP
jgi:hypothetical protein